MPRRAICLGLLAVISLSLRASTADAQSPAPFAIPPGTPVCQCAGYQGPHYHLGTAPAMSGRARGTSGGNPALNPNGVSPNEVGLPRGRRYYGGRYFGSFNNRYYGPQYGYF